MEIFVVLLVIGVVAAFAGSISGKRRTNEAWQVAARRLGLHFRAGDIFTAPEISGRRDGCKVLIETVSPSGDTSTKHTRYRVTFPNPLGLGLRLAEPGFLTEISKLIGNQELEVGAQLFNARVVVKGRDPDRVLAFFTPPRRYQIRRLFATQPGVVVDDESITWTQHTVERVPSEITAAVQRMVEVALELSPVRSHRRAPEVETPRPTSGARLEPDVSELPSPGHQVEPERLQASAAPGETAAADGVAGDRGADPEVESADAPRHGRPVTSPSDAEVAATDEGPTARELSERLFGTGVLSYEVTRIFEEHYRGRPVRWEGRLSHALPYPFDLVFGNERGTKADFEIGTSTERYGTRSVRAVVQFPANALSTLRRAVGTTLSFRGTLVACDSFMSRIYVADGSIADWDPANREG